MSSSAPALPRVSSEPSSPTPLTAPHRPSPHLTAPQLANEFIFRSGAASGAVGEGERGGGGGGGWGGVEGDSGRGLGEESQDEGEESARYPCSALS
ncbi:unnamed protein product [Closterium sp. Yama58-4]|nr:unnamed protein product [Closterium sp. Yama58-4]CAI5482410.1 unnamed protein product [Closterium sp. Yama58-4]